MLDEVINSLDLLSSSTHPSLPSFVHRTPSVFVSMYVYVCMCVTMYTHTCFGLYAHVRAFMSDVCNHVSIISVLVGTMNMNM